VATTDWKFSRSALTLVVMAVVMLLVYEAAYLVGAGLKPPRIDMPPYDVKDLPWEIQLPSGTWKGDNAHIPESLTRALKSQAKVVENREYFGPRGQKITMHIAIFGDHQLGLTHTPFECYRGNGWNKLDSEYAEVQSAQGRTAEISVSLWRMGERRVYVLYWYQFGNEVLLDRDDLGRFRWKMAGKESWPALVKVLLETRGESTADRQAIVEMAEYIYRWMTGEWRSLQPGTSGAEGEQEEPSTEAEQTTSQAADNMPSGASTSDSPSE